MICIYIWYVKKIYLICVYIYIYDMYIYIYDMYIYIYMLCIYMLYMYILCIYIKIMYIYYVYIYIHVMYIYIWCQDGTPSSGWFVFFRVSKQPQGSQHIKHLCVGSPLSVVLLLAVQVHPGSQDPLNGWTGWLSFKSNNEHVNIQ